MQQADCDLWLDSGLQEVLDSMKYMGEHLESLLAPNHSLGQFDSDGWRKSGIDMLVHTEGHCVFLLQQTRVNRGCSYLK